MADAAAHSAEPHNSLTIDDLAAKTRVPSRTIRFYQGKDVLQKPEMRGRVAFYGDSHVERLALVCELQDRGLTIRAIRDVVSRLEKGELDVNEWLGLEDKLKEPWANDRPKVLDREELRALVHDETPGRIAELVRTGLVERKGESFFVQSPALLAAAMKLEESGSDLETSQAALGIFRKHLSRTAKELVEFYFTRAREGSEHGAAAKDLSQAMGALKPTAMDVLTIVFAQEIEREIQRSLESGEMVKLSHKKRR